MESIHELSSVAPLGEFDLWGVPPTQITVEKDSQIEFRPLSVIDTSSPITFLLNSPIDEYLKLDTLQLYFTVKISLTKNDKSALTLADWVNFKPCNYLMHAMIKKVDYELNGKQVFNLPQNYPYRANIEATLGFSKDSKDSFKESELWMPESARCSIFKPTGTDFSSGPKVEILGKLHTDLSFQGRALLGGCQLKISITLNEPKFYMEKGSDYSLGVEINDVCIYVHKAKISSTIVDAHRRALNISPAKYPITRVEVKQVPITQGLMDVWLDNLIYGQLPRRMFLAFVENEAFNGSFLKDPFKYQHFNVNFLACFLDGIQYPSIAYTPDFKNKLITKEFRGLFKTLNQDGTDCHLVMSREEFIARPIFGFNFAPDLSDGCGMIGHVNPIRRGIMRLQLKFSEILPKAINVIAYCEFDNIIEIHSDGTVLNNVNGFQGN